MVLMNESLLGRLFATIMNWDAETVSQERPNLELLAKHKYNFYQNFFPGMRFIESLAYWLDQFETLEERNCAYEFIKKRLIYISNDELEHFVSIAYQDHINRILIKLTAEEIDIPIWEIRRIINSKEYELMRRQTIFLGLSDGAHMDLFRRSNPVLSHEQILRSHEISEDRAQDMLKELEKSITIILSKKPSSNEVKFRNVFLLDDFSASGLSYLRIENGEYKGKIANFFNNACDYNGKIYDMFDHSKLYIGLMLYISTEKAIKKLRMKCKKMFKDVNFSINAVYILSDSIKINEEDNKDIIKIMEKYYDSSIETKSYHVGKMEKPWFGFDECCLPLILNHNTPNNSVPILWFDQNCKYRGLFPRVSRHGS